jgi:hypothetical protein
MSLNPIHPRAAQKATPSAMAAMVEIILRLETCKKT